MNWEAVTAIGTVFTGLVILVTVLVGYHQLRTTVDQLQQLRRASQLDAANVIFAELSSPTFLEARRFVLDELPERMNDPKFREEVEHSGRGDENVHKELTVLRTFERIALYCEQELLDPQLIYYLASGRVADTWEALSDVVAIHRSSVGAPIWAHFEKLYEDTLTFMTNNIGFSVDRYRAVAARIRARRAAAASSTKDIRDTATP